MKINWRKTEEKIFLVITGTVAIFVASMLLLIIGKIALEGLPYINLDYLTKEEFRVGPGQAIGNAIVGTILIGIMSVALATPLAVATAVYMKRYAKENALTHGLSFLIDVLSGTPSIIMGLFGYLILVVYLKEITGGYSLISGSVALAILILPVIEKSVESAIDTVPMDYEHASFALGSNLWQTIRRITIPCAFPGIITGIILGIGRACEESAVVKLTTSYAQYFPDFAIIPSKKYLLGNEIQPLNNVVGTLPITIFNNYDYPKVKDGYIFAAALVLIVIVLGINICAKAVLWRFKIGAKRTPLIPVALTAGGRKILKLPFIVKATTVTMTDGAGNDNKIGKFARWLTTDKKKKAKEREDTTVSTKTSEIALSPEVYDRAYDQQIVIKNPVRNAAQPDQDSESESTIYSTEATNKAIEAMDKCEASMPESTSYQPESNQPPVVIEPAEEVLSEDDNVEPVQEINNSMEPLSVEETEATLKSSAEPVQDTNNTLEQPSVDKAMTTPRTNADDNNDKVNKLVKWLVTDPKKETTKINEPVAGKRDSRADTTAVPPVSPQSSPQSVSGQPGNASNLEIIPPATVIRNKKKSETNPDLVVYPSQLTPVVREPDEVHELTDKKDAGKAGGLVKWFLTDPKKEAAKKKDPASVRAEVRQAPAVPTIPDQQSSRPAVQPGSASKGQTAVTHPASSSDIADMDSDRNIVIYPPQSPPSLEEISETLGKKGKKGGKSGGIVKWLLTDPKKDAAKAQSGDVAGNSYATDGSVVAGSPGARTRKSKQKNNSEMPEFNVGKLAQPSLDISVRDTDFTYAIDPPFQYVHIFFDGEELVYNVMEPLLGDAQKRFMAIIERGLEKLISSKIVAIKPEERELFLRDKFDEIIDLYGWKLNGEYRDRMFYYLRKRYLGYDKIDVIMKDHFIEDISCNGPNSYLYVFHRIYGSVRTNVSYGDVELNKFVMRMAQISGRHISILQPIKDISLPDGSRANLTLGTEVTKKGATFTIRKFKDRPISPIELVDYNSIDARALAYLWTLLDYKRSILVSGGTASGKTTLMNALCIFIRPELKIVSLEDTPELNLVHPNWIQSVTRSGFGAESGGGAESISGVSGVSAKSPGNIGLYDLLVAALRQRPEYILVGEVRGVEAFTLFQAIAVGHACMGTIHAGNMRELLSRVESNPMNVPRTLFAAMDVVCFSAMIRKGDRNVRRVMQIVEILELDTEGNLITNPVFRWDAVSDRFVFTGKSHIFEKIEALLGIRQEALIKEMDNRAAFLLRLRSEGIRDYTTVVENIREYELNKITGNQ